MTETQLREQICLLGKSLFDRGYTHGSTGNISAKTEDGWLLTPTNSCLGRLDPAYLSKMSWDGKLLAGDAPSKEAFLHLAMYEERRSFRAVVHLHGSDSVAVSLLGSIDCADCLPPLTAYYIMRIGYLPLVPYFKPGDLALADAVREAAKKHHALLLANHGPVVAGTCLSAAADAAEELEQTAKIFLNLRHEKLRTLSSEQVDELRRAFPPPP
ncbi:MAG: aldolase [Pseudomonadota bacterium]|nr:aldolase [Pseudomonadota bacterium]